MDSQPVPSTGPWVGDGARIAGRAVIVGGIAIGLMFGLVWWVLVGWRADRQPVAEVALPQGGSSARFLPFTTPSPAETTAPVVPAPPLPSQPAPTSPSAGAVAPLPPATARPPAVLAAHYVTTTVWDTGYVAQITVTTAAAGPQNYEVRIQLPAGVTVNGAWSSAASSSSSVAGASVTLRGGPVSAQRSVLVGFQAAKPAALAKPGSFEPTSCTVNGNPCT